MEKIIFRSRFRLALVLAGLALLAAACHYSPTVFAADNANWRDKVSALADKNFKHPAWGFSHSKRNYALAQQLAAADGVTLDDDVLFAASYLHDMATFQPWAKQGTDHADAAADSAPAVLKEAGFPVAKIPAVQEAIRTHMPDRVPVGAEARYLHDADALDWLGVIGAVRVLALIDDKNSDPSAADVAKELEATLKDVPGKVVSPAGKALVEVRRAELEQFLKALSAQTNGFDNL